MSHDVGVFAPSMEYFNVTDYGDERRRSEEEEMRLKKSTTRTAKESAKARKVSLCLKCFAKVDWRFNPDFNGYIVFDHDSDQEHRCVTDTRETP